MSDDAGASDRPPRRANPHDWVTEKVLRQFLRERGVPRNCELCGQDSMGLVDAGDGELIGSLPAYGRRPDGIVDTSNSRHLPVARMFCVNCGNVRLFSLYALDNWRNLNGATVTVAHPDDEAEATT